LVPPTITAQPTNQTVSAGSTINFQVSASGSSPLTYQWWFNGTNALGTSANMLTLANVQTSQAGGYSVTVANSAGTVASVVATLTIGLPPSITQQPTNLTVIQGQSATFSMTSSGDMPLGYQWRFNGAPVGDGTNSTYTLAQPTPASAGAYDAVVSNVFGSATSVVAQLTVLVPPSITAQPTNQTVMAGDVASFFANATGSPPMSYQWLFYKKPIPGATVDTLSITNVQAFDAGIYALVITNAAGSATSSNAYLKVLVAPTLAAPGTQGPGGISIPVPSLSGLSYLLEYKNTLEDPDWTAVTSWAPGTGGILVFQDTNAPSAPRFYRVRCH
jgi:Immunoglobulin domain